MTERLIAAEMQPFYQITLTTCYYYYCTIIINADISGNVPKTLHRGRQAFIMHITSGRAVINDAWNDDARPLSVDT